MTVQRSLALLRRARSALAFVTLLVVGPATPVALLAPTPVQAQTCSVNKAGTCQIDQVQSKTLSTTEGTAVTTTDPSEAKTGGSSQSVCDIDAPYPVYCGNGVLTPPSNGVATDDLSNGGLITYTPNPGFVGTDTFVTQTGLITDGLTRAWIITTTFTVTVTAATNPAPAVSNTSLSTAYDTPGSVALPSSGTVSSFQVAGAPGHGAATISGSTAIYTPNAGFFGADSFTFLATGPGGTSNTATVAVTVAPPPAPVAQVGSISTTYGVAGSTTLSASGVMTGYAIATAPAHGSVSLSGATATYTPALGYAGSDSFTFYATGPGGNSNIATISVTVAPPPPPPPAAIPGSATTPENTQVSVTLAGTGGVAGYAIVSNPSHGTVSLSGAVASYTPSVGYIGPDSFSFDVSGPTGTSSPATISVTVSPPPPPSLSNASISTAYENTGSTALASTGVVTSYALASSPSHGAATLSGSTAIYTPNAGFIGSDSFTVVASGPGGSSNVATVGVSVAAPPAPVASGGAISTAYDTAGSITLSASGVVSSYAISGLPSHGTVSVSGAVATYTPAAGYYGSDSFTFTASGPGGTSAPATISVTVGLPPAPVAASGSMTTPYETPATVTLPGSGLISSYAIVTGTIHGTVALSGASVTYTPAAGSYGPDSFTYLVTGPGGSSAPATISVSVGLPPAPMAAGGSIATPYNTAAVTILAGSGVISSYVIVSGPSHGTASLSGSQATYTPAAGYIGADSFSFHVVGPGGTSAPAVVSVTVQAPPAPAASNGSLSVAYDTPGSVTLSATGAASSYAIVSSPSHGSVSLAGAVATYTPQAGYIGTDSFTFDATGPGGVSAPATIAVTVEPPVAPVASPGSLTCPYQTTCTTTLTSTGLGSIYTLATQATNGTCSISGSTLTYVPAWGAVGSDSCTFTVTGPGGTSAPATISITNGAPPLPNPGGPTGTPIPTSGASIAICLAGQAASVPGLPGPPTGTVYDPNWCDEQALTIAQQALQLQNQQTQVATLQSQLAVQQKMVQSLGSDSTSSTLAQVNAKAQAILQQAAGIGFNAQAAGGSFAAAYPGGETVAGFNGSQLNAAMQAWRANAAQALQTSVAVQAQIAQSQGGVASSIQSAVNASNAAPGPTGAHQATNQILSAVSTQLSQLQDLLLAESQAYAALAAAKQQAAGAAAASTAQTQGQVAKPLTAPPGVTDTTHM